MAIKPVAIDHVRQGGEPGFGARHVVRRLLQRVIGCSVLAVAATARLNTLSDSPNSRGRNISAMRTNLGDRQ